MTQYIMSILDKLVAKSDVDAGQRALERMIELVPANSHFICGSDSLKAYQVPDVLALEKTCIVSDDTGIFLGHNTAPTGDHAIILHDEEKRSPRELKHVLTMAYKGSVRVECFGHGVFLAIYTKAPQKRFSLSLAMPIRDEAEDLDRVLSSFFGVVDEIIIAYDTRTKDNSLEIIKKYTDNIIEFNGADLMSAKQFKNIPKDKKMHFASARNLCLKQCTSDYVFHCEGHESLDPKSVDVILNYNPQADVIYITRNLEPISEIAHPFVHKRIPGIQYEREVHNLLVWDQEKHSIVVEPSIRTYHRRSKERENARQEQRNAINIRSMRHRATEDPTDWRSKYFLANSYFGQKEFKKALNFYLEFLDVADPDEQTEYYQVGIYAGTCLMNLGEHKRAIELLKTHAYSDWSRNEHWTVMADCAIKTGDYMLAYRFAKIAASYEKPVSQYTLNPLSYSVIPYGLMTRAMIGLNKPERAYKITEEFFNTFFKDDTFDMEQKNASIGYYLIVNKEFRNKYNKDLIKLHKE